jgi:hypothetical protein
MLKDTDEADSAAENNFTGIETIPKEIVPEPSGRAGMKPL